MAGILAGEIMDEAAIMLNDGGKVTFTYLVMTPWLKRSINKLTDELAVNSIKLVDKIAALVTVAANATSVNLPVDALYPIKLEERESGSSFPFNNMEEVISLPAGVSLGSSLGIWSFQGTLFDSVPVIDLIGSTTARQVRITYVRFLPYAQITGATPETIDLGTSIVWNAKSYLAAKTAEYISRFILINAKRASELKGESGECLYRLTQIWTKKAQSTPVRKPSFNRRHSW